MATVTKSSRVLETTLATDSAGPFALGFRLFDTDGFEVYVDGVQQTVTADYTISASFVDGYDDSATISFTSTLSAGSDLVVYGKMVADRDTDYADGDPNLTFKLNAELARHAAMLSEVQRDTRRAVLIIGSENVSLLPEPLGLLGFDGSGNLTVLAGTTDSPVSVAMAPVLAESTLALARAAFGLGTIATQDADNVAITGGAIDVSTLAIGGDPVAPAKVGSTFATVGGTANDLTLTTDPAITPVEGTELRFKLTNTNTGASTVAINGGAAMDIETVTGVATPAGYLTADEWVTGIVTGGAMRVFWATPRTGSNANGEWAQWDNGRMEAHIPPRYTGRFKVSSSTHNQTVDLPVAFYMPNGGRQDVEVQITAYPYNSNDVYHLFQARLITATDMLVQYRSGYSTADADPMITIFGRWF